MRTRRSTEVAPKCALRIFLLEEVLLAFSFTIFCEKRGEMKRSVSNLDLHDDLYIIREVIA